jgi:hypothetical protein
MPHWASLQVVHPTLQLVLMRNAITLQALTTLLWGHEAMHTNTASANNVAVGHQAGYYFNGASALNTYVGYRAGFSSTGANSSDYGNVFIGYNAGYSLANAGGSQTGIYNTFIGTSSG